jgi:hypothetical protein
MHSDEMDRNNCFYHEIMTQVAAIFRRERVESKKNTWNRAKKINPARSPARTTPSRDSSDEIMGEQRIRRFPGEFMATWLVCSDN